jgi:ketosteroid isomerase-like protein
MSIRQQIEECYSAYASRDFEGTMAPFADNVCFEWPASPDQAKWSGCCEGREAMINQLGRLANQFDFLDVQLIDLIVDGSKAAARVAMKLRNRNTGAEFTNQSGHFWRFENDKCVELIEYYDSALVSAHTD